MSLAILSPTYAIADLFCTDGENKTTFVKTWEHERFNTKVVTVGAGSVAGIIALRSALITSMTSYGSDLPTDCLRHAAEGFEGDNSVEFAFAYSRKDKPTQFFSVQRGILVPETNFPLVLGTQFNTGVAKGYLTAIGDSEGRHLDSLNGAIVAAAGLSNSVTPGCTFIQHSEAP